MQRSWSDRVWIEFLFANHGLRDSMNFLLIRSVHADSSVILHSGQTNTTTLARYHNIRFTERIHQQKSLFKSDLEKDSFCIEKDILPTL